MISNLTLRFSAALVRHGDDNIPFMVICNCSWHSTEVFDSFYGDFQLQLAHSTAVDQLQLTFNAVSHKRIRKSKRQTGNYDAAIVTYHKAVGADNRVAVTKTKR